MLYPDELKISRRLARIIHQEIFEITCDTAFDRVIKSCAQVRLKDHQETWILEEMIEAYGRLFESGYAHSVEVWHEGELAGGLYGVSLGGCFFGESMFTYVSNASKVALGRVVRFLKQMSFDFIDCQVTTAHLLRMGAREIPRAYFLKELKKSIQRPTLRGRWQMGF